MLAATTLGLQRPTALCSHRRSTGPLKQKVAASQRPRRLTTCAAEEKTETERPPAAPSKVDGRTEMIGSSAGTRRQQLVPPPLPPPLPPAACRPCTEPSRGPCMRLNGQPCPPAAVQAPAPSKFSRKSDSTQLTELDIQALRAKSAARAPHKLEWPVKRSFAEVAWCALEGRELADHSGRGCVCSQVWGGRPAADRAAPHHATPTPHRTRRDRALESAEDISSHLRRQIRELPTTKAFDKLIGRSDGTLRLQADKPVVLLLGSGWGAHSIMKVGGRAGGRGGGGCWAAASEAARVRNGGSCCWAAGPAASKPLGRLGQPCCCPRADPLIAPLRPPPGGGHRAV